MCGVVSVCGYVMSVLCGGAIMRMVWVVRVWVGPCLPKDRLGGTCETMDVPANLKNTFQNSLHSHYLKMLAFTKL